MLAFLKTGCFLEWLKKNKKQKQQKKNSDYTQYFWEKCFVVLSQEVTRNTIARSFQSSNLTHISRKAYLSSAEASLCCGEAGEKEKESARGTMVPRALSIFSIIDILMGIPSGSLCGGERKGLVTFWAWRQILTTKSVKKNSRHSSYLTNLWGFASLTDS